MLVLDVPQSGDERRSNPIKYTSVPVLSEDPSMKKSFIGLNSNLLF
jgi:hypothetical protein